MKNDFLKALRIFKYLFIAFSVLFWIRIVSDDWVFIEKYGATNLLDIIGGWIIWFLVFTLIVSLFFWSIATIFILVKNKLKG